MTGHPFDASYSGLPADARCVMCGAPRLSDEHPVEVERQHRRDALLVLRAVRDGLPLDQALANPDAARVRIVDLLTAIPGIERPYARTLCDEMCVSEMKAAGALSDRQRRVLVARVDRLHRRRAA